MKAEETVFHGFDVFMILFTLVTLYGLIRSYKAKNFFAVAFCSVTFLTFMLANTVMVMNWFQVLDDVMAAIGWS